MTKQRQIWNSNEKLKQKKIPVWKRWSMLQAEYNMSISTLKKKIQSENRRRMGIGHQTPATPAQKSKTNEIFSRSRKNVGSWFLTREDIG